MRKTKVTKSYCSSINKSKKSQPVLKSYNSAKDINHSKKPKKPAKHVSPKSLDERVSRYFILSQKRTPMVLIEDKAEEVVRLVYTDDSLTTLGDIYIHLGISYLQASNYQERSEKFASAIELAKTFSGNRRDKKAIHREWDFKSISINQSVYSPVWKSQEERHAKLRNDNAKQEQKVIVIDRINEKEEDDETKCRTENISQ